MKRNRTFLDFTSLLDIIMIILFCFLVSFKNMADDAKATAAEQIAQYESDKAELDKERAEFELDKEKWNRETDLAAERQGQNVEEILNFSNSTNIRAVLNVEQEKAGWSVDIYQGDDRISQIEGTEAEKMCEEMSAVISGLGYTNDSTLLCEFVYDGGQTGTRIPFMTTEKMFEELQKKYEHLFYSKINLHKFN